MSQNSTEYFVWIEFTLLYSDTVCLFKYVIKAWRRFFTIFWSSNVHPSTAVSNFLSTICWCSAVTLAGSSCTLHAFRNVWHRWRASMRSLTVNNESMRLFTWCSASSCAPSRTVFTQISIVDKRLLIRCE